MRQRGVEARQRALRVARTERDPAGEVQRPHVVRIAGQGGVRPALGLVEARLAIVERREREQRLEVVRRDRDRRPPLTLGVVEAHALEVHLTEIEMGAGAVRHRGDGRRPQARAVVPVAVPDDRPRDRRDRGDERDGEDDPPRRNTRDGRAPTRGVDDTRHDDRDAHHRQVEIVLREELAIGHEVRHR